MAYKIMIDAGHGGDDPGATFQGRQEKDDNLRLALAVGRILEDNGIDVEYTRTTDIYQTPFQKATLANQSGADFFISFHRNSSPMPNQYSGIETLVYDKSGIKYEMAQNINGAVSELGFRNLGVKERPGLVVLRRTNMPALLIETGFINTETDNRLFDEKFNEIAQAIANAILGTLDMETIERTQIEDEYDKYSMETESDTSFGRPPQTERPDTQQNRTNISEPQQMQPNMSRPQQWQSDWSRSQQGQMQNPASQQFQPNWSRPQQDPMQNPASQQFQPDWSRPDWSRPNRPGRPMLPEDMAETFYRVQVGAYRDREYADNLVYELEDKGFPAFLIYEDGFFKVQVGAFRNLGNAIRMEQNLRQAGYSTWITT